MSEVAMKLVRGGPAGPVDPFADEGLWDAARVAKYLGVSRSWVYHRVSEGTIPHLRLLTGLTRFQPDAIRAYARGEWKPSSVHED